MTENNKSYRIRTDVDAVDTDKYISIDANFVEDYDSFDILSVSLKSSDTYKLQNSNYGVIVGRVIANGGFGVPNAKISIFIPSEGDNKILNELYPFTSIAGKDNNNVRYNLLPDEEVADCHQVVGTFPNKRYVLDNDDYIELFDKYYKYTTRTNNSGDYMICGVPCGTHTLHMDLDLSDCGILSQRPRDFVYKGYTIEQFETPNMFKDGTEYGNLSQIFSQDRVVTVKPFWGNSSLGEPLGITRTDIEIAFKFEPTCVFLGSVACDNASQGFSKKCIPTDKMGAMDELTTGEGKIEMIRKTPGGSVEEFQIKGTQLINANGIWCYQIPMNLDYMTTDEYGNMVPTDDPSRGIPTRTRVRFRVSMTENENNTDNYFRAKVLVPHNPQMLPNGKKEDYDYDFGTNTKEESFRDLFWNNVYSVKSYIPRIQKKKPKGWVEDKFSGIKNCNIYGQNNPIPYNNIRIKLPFIFTVMCLIIKIFIRLVSILNFLTTKLGNMIADTANTKIVGWYPLAKLQNFALALKLTALKQGLCPDLENWYFTPMPKSNGLGYSPAPPEGYQRYNMVNQTLLYLEFQDDEDYENDKKSLDYTNRDNEDRGICFTIKTDYLMSCIEMNLAQEYKVINFDFYNDWINGLIYIPRWMRLVKHKKKFLGKKIAKVKIKGCMDDTKVFSKTRKYTQMCSLPYKYGQNGYTEVGKNDSQKYHKKKGFIQEKIFGKNGGIVHEHPTMYNQAVYYIKPCEWTRDGQNKKVNLFATDIILLGSLNECDLNGIPQAFKYLTSSSYIMPTNLALTNMDTNGPLYTTDKDSFCNGRSQQRPTNDSALLQSEGIKEQDISKGGLTKELNAFSGTGSDNYDIMYDENEETDTIALTEAAGISWNWTGPGQGKAVKDKLYLPGGHFLGLSCFNSETNIKSCLNLTRICEIGAAMSQRKEEPRKLTDDGVLEYVYTVPSGFISGNDIIDTNFRTMFATMNNKRLIATRINPETGYKTYDFVYMRPNNFSGEFKEYVNDRSGLYNRKIDVIDESESLKKYNVADASKRDDYDPEESGYTQVKTIESTSEDYYMFRFGLLDTKDKNLQERHFLKQGSGGSVYLPQYENSYYFYFGMKYGATAIDEFNKQFFSECETKKLGLEKGADINVTDIDICRGVGTVTIVATNLDLPYQNIKYYNIDLPNQVTQVEDNDILKNTVVNIKDLKIGNSYIFIIQDSEGFEFRKQVDVGTDLATCNYVKVDFNYNADKKPKRPSDRDEFDGGYVIIKDIKISGQTVSHGGLHITDMTDTDTGSKPALYKEGGYICYVPKPHTYKFKISCKLGEDCEQSTYTLFIESFKDTSKTTLYIGNRNGTYTELERDININEITGSFSNEVDWAINNSLTDSSISSVMRSNIFSINGTKIVWGTPQNSQQMQEGKPFLYEKDYFSENEGNNESILAGYTVDDDACYFANEIYIDNSEGLSGTVTTLTEENPNYWCISAISDDMPYGKDYYCKIEDGVANQALENDRGYIFKSIKDNRIDFVTGSNYSDLLSGCTGVLFKSYKTPIIKAPFYANVSFIKWQHKGIDFVPTDEGISKISVDETDMGGVFDGFIMNGKRKENNFSSIFIDPSENGLVREKLSLSGSASTRQIFIKENIDEDEEKELPRKLYSEPELGYSITEGLGYDSNDTYLAQTISDSMAPAFFENIFYDDNGNLCTIGTSSDDVNYYPIDKSDLIEEGGDISFRYEDHTYYYCAYTSAATFNIEGEGVIVDEYNDGISFKYKTNEGEATYIASKTLNEYLSDEEQPLIEKVIKKSVISGNCTVEKIESLISAGETSVEGKIIVGKCERVPAYFNDIVVDKPDNAPTIMLSDILSAKTTMYKIYPYVKKIKRSYANILNDLRVDPLMFNFGNGNESSGITIEGVTGMKWEATVSGASWVSVYPPNSTQRRVNGRIKVDKNPTTDDRSATIIYKYTNSDKEGKVVTVTQAAGSGQQQQEQPSTGVTLSCGPAAVTVTISETGKTMNGFLWLFNDVPLDSGLKKVKFTLPDLKIKAHDYTCSNNRGPSLKISPYVVYADNGGTQTYTEGNIKELELLHNNAEERYDSPNGILSRASGEYKFGVKIEVDGTGLDDSEFTCKITVSTSTDEGYGIFEYKD